MGDWPLWRGNPVTRRPPPASGIGCHLDTRKMWPGCDDALKCRKHDELFPGTCTIGRTGPALMKWKSVIKDHMVANHVIQSQSAAKKDRPKKCGCIDRFGCSCSCPNSNRVSADTHGCHPPRRRMPDRRRLLGNFCRLGNSDNIDHTNDACAMRKSRSCPTVRRRGWGPHTYKYMNSNSAEFAERGYEMKFWQQELVREIEKLEEASRELKVQICEAESAFAETHHPLGVATECLNRHHKRTDFDGAITDEVEETLMEEKNYLRQWREKIDHEIENLHTQTRRNCQLGDSMTTEYHNRGQTKPAMIDQIDHYSLSFKPNSSQKTVRPEMWSYRVKDLVQASYVERDKTERLCARVQRIVREGMNEIWQNANVTTNSLVARVGRIQRQKRVSQASLTEVTRTIEELERLTEVMKRAIREKELGLKKNTIQIDERTRHVNMDVCSDVILQGMKKEYRDICEDIKLTKSKLAEIDLNLENLRRRRASFRRHISVKDRDLKIDTVGCLPLRSDLKIDTRGGPIVTIPFLHSS